MVKAFEAIAEREGCGAEDCIDRGSEGGCYYKNERVSNA